MDRLLEPEFDLLALALLAEYDLVALLFEELDDLELVALLADLPELLLDSLELLELCG